MTFNNHKSGNGPDTPLCQTPEEVLRDRISMTRIAMKNLEAKLPADHARILSEAEQLIYDLTPSSTGGMRLLPVDPTPEMQAAGFAALGSDRDCTCDQYDCYKAMIEAAPFFTARLLQQGKTEPFNGSDPNIHAQEVGEAVLCVDAGGGADLGFEARKATQSHERRPDVLVSVEQLLSVIERHGRWIRNSLKEDEFTELDDAAAIVRATLSAEAGSRANVSADPTTRQEITR